MKRAERWAVPALVVVLGAAGLYWMLKPDPRPDVVLYCGVDQDQSRPIADLFAQATGLTLAFHGEGEAQRSIGISRRLEEEQQRPGADVAWLNEIMHMVHLSNIGVIAPLPPGLAEEFPEAWRDPRGRFVQFGARARVLLVNLRLLPDPADHPTSVRDLINPKYAELGLVSAMARPLTGTTYTHAVAMLTEDEPAANAFFDDVVAAAEAGHLKLVKSNGQVMRAVKEGEAAFGLTDTDDSWIAMQRSAGDPVAIIYPDQGEGQPGAVLIPNTAGLVAGGPNPDNARRLLRWLVSRDNEARLAAGPSAQIPVRPDVEVPADGHVKIPGRDFRAAVIDWHAVGANVDRWRDVLTRRFRAAE